MTETDPTPPSAPSPAIAPVGGLKAALGPPATYFGPTPTADEKNMGMLIYLLGILTNVVGPLILWLMKKETSPFINDQGKEVLNFQITTFLACLILAITVVGIILTPVIAIAYVVLMVIGMLKAKDGVAYRFPFALRLLK